MQIVLIDTEKIYEISLPKSISGKFWVEDTLSRGDAKKVLGIEADSEKQAWVVKKNANVQGFKIGEETVERIWLEPGSIYRVILGRDDLHEAYLMAEEENDSFQQFTKYRVKGNALITVGRSRGQSIQLNNALVSGEHLTLSHQNGSWAILSVTGKNGTYVNSVKIDGATALNPGDTINVLFYKIIIGYDFIAINDPNHTVYISADILTEISAPTKPTHFPTAADSQQFFYRSPHFTEEFEGGQIKVDMPPNPERKDNTPILLTIAPAMLMGLASVSTGIISVINTLENDGNIIKTLPTIIMSVSMLGGMIVFPIIMKKRERKKAAEWEQERRDKYMRYLEKIRGEIQRVKKIQEKKYNEKLPAILSYVERDAFWERNLWERTIEQPDFLQLRLGTGNLAMNYEVVFPEEKFTIEEDPLREEMFSLQKEERFLMDVPISVSLIENRVLGIVGDVKDVYNMLNNLLLQIFLLHAYDEVKVVFLYDEADESSFSYVRKAQHLWDDKGKRRFLAVNENNLRELNVEMGGILNRRAENSTEKDGIVLPYYIVISASKSMSNRCSFISEVLGNEGLAGISVICAYDEIRNLPKECHTYATVGGSRGILFSRDCQTGFLQDIVSSSDAEKYVGRMSNVIMDLQQGRFDLPEMMTFMDMFRVGDFHHLNVIQRWQENDPVKSLRTPVGVDTNGELFYLDLHEKFHGPHGLVAGMTGSGKSEFLITYILSMAVNYHPNEVAFVLIDYKGGGLTGAFDNEHYRLPHLAGTITNLDGSAVMRSILSIKSELRKRQMIFNQARAVANEGTMDIYKYQKLFRDGKVDEPVPHLFIIADEFAELKSQQPEFLEQLISTARIGRSLGVHLILATQKPSGVVSEQIWANSKFKVCLKVQDRADSMDMLKRPDAAELVETGRFYLQVGYNELFELGQSSWCGAPYVEQSDDMEVNDDPIEMIDELGNVIEKIKPGADKGGVKKGKQIVRIMEHLGELAEMLNIEERQLWQPELPKILLWEDLCKKYSAEDEGGLEALIGEVDDPYSQSRYALKLDFAKSGNLLLYGAAGSGKELLLTTLIYALYSKYSAKDLNLYVLDFGSEFLKNFENAPQTGSVILDGQEERISALFSMLQKEIKSRKKRLSDYGGSVIEYRKDQTDMPFMLVIVNNYAQFVENYEQYEDRLTVLTREGQKYGIYFVMTATSSSAIRYRISQNFINTYVLQLNDKSDYMTILGNTNGVYPSAVKGRGILKDGETYVFQTAMLTEGEADNRELVRAFCNDLQKLDNSGENHRLKVVPRFISGKELEDREWRLDTLPIGIDQESCEMVTLDLLQKGICWVLAENDNDSFRFARGVLEALSKSNEMKTLLFDPDGKDSRDEGSIEVIASDLEGQLIQIFQMAVERNNTYKTNQTIQKPEMLIVIHGYARIKDALSEDGKDKLRVLLEKVEPFWNMGIIICDAYSETNKYSLEAWIRTKIKNDGIWIGDGIDNQIRFKLNDKSAQKLQGDMQRVGYLAENGGIRALRIVLPEEERRESDNEE
ncbi:MAG: type VII secretion protein EssC [Acetatifactor sp.]|nr:type VII secretion protein EssC [Acetatifactor sp.]